MNQAHLLRMAISTLMTFMEGCSKNTPVGRLVGQAIGCLQAALREGWHEG